MNRAPKLLWIVLALICSAALLQAGLPPTTIGAWTSAANLSQPRTNAASVLLTDGRVLITGGDSGSGALNSAEIYDPAADSWTQTTPMTSARANASAALLQDGRVLIAGGDNSGTPS
ncbi:MAG TPA: kelch repeat-containing protein, partial [Terriglobales bacterium]|nr:kelch repeat-containing protein [Terriglobales bacterium]